MRAVFPARAFLLVLSLLLSGPTAEAQQTPRRLLPEPPSEAARPVARPEVSGAPAPTIRREAIGAPSLASVGLGRPRFAFAGPLWPQAEADRLLALLERLPERLALPALRDLARRLLTAPGPRLDDGLALLTSRARALERIGDPGLAAELLMAPGVAESRAAREEAALLAFAAAGASRSCGLAEGLPGEQPWLVAVRIACALREGDRALAGLRLELARERGIVFTPDFLALVDAARVGEPLPVSLPTAAERPAVLLLIGALPVGSPGIAGELMADPAVLAALARNPGAPAGIRLPAAEAAAAAGWLDAEALRTVYLETAGTEETSDAGTRAMLVARLAAETVPAARAALLVEAEPVRAAGVERLLWLRVLAPDAKMLVPDPALDWAAEAVLFALLAAGETDAVAQWAELLERRVKERGEGRAALARIERLLALAALRPLPEPLGIAGERQLLLFATLADALGLSLPAADWGRLLAGEGPAGGDAPPLSLWRESEIAAAEGRPGEGLLAALGLFGDMPASAPPLALWRALRGIVTSGEPAVARATAVELALVWRL